MFFLKLLVLFILSLNLYAQEAYIDSITLSKIKKLVQKEELIAKAYKEYVLTKGTTPTNLTTLIDGIYLPLGFSIINPFGKTMTLDISNNQIDSFLPSSMELKSNSYDYYYTNKNRTNTKAPLSLDNNSVNISLSSKEKYITTWKDSITTTKANALNKYYLDTNGVLHWYDINGVYKFSVDKDLIIDESITILDSDGSFNSDFEALMLDKDAMYAGQIILHEEDGVVEEYINTGDTLILLDDSRSALGSTIIQFSRRSGGMIVNGDIYTWGNNANRITSINIDDYTTTAGTAGTRHPVITSLVRAKAKVYDDDTSDSENLEIIDTKNYFSSPLRPKFDDFFSTVYHSTCGVTTEGELYCGGSTGTQFTFGSQFTHTDNEGSNGREMLYRSTFFNGASTSPKAEKVFANNQIWHILTQEGDIYRWGYDWSGFSGNGSKQFNYSSRDTSKDPELISITDNSTSVKFDDITYLLTIGYRKIGALSTTGNIYIWGIEDDNSNNICSETWGGITFNLCSPTKVTIDNSTLSEDVQFNSIKGGLEAFVATDISGNYYKIYQPKSNKIQVESISETIKTYSEYSETDDSEILSVDFSSKLTNGTLGTNDGVVWVNGNNKLKGDYFTSSNENDTVFKNAISKIKWKQIKVIQDDNGMCGIDTSNQMYCWGIMSFYRSGSSTIDKIGNTFMIPVFNTNLYDFDKDYMIAEGGYSEYLTNITSGDWSRDSDGAFFMKYPTYIGGFNYEFVFK